MKTEETEGTYFRGIRQKIREYLREAHGVDEGALWKIEGRLYIEDQPLLLDLRPVHTCNRPDQSDGVGRPNIDIQTPRLQFSHIENVVHQLQHQSSRSTYTDTRKTK